MKFKKTMILNFIFLFGILMVLTSCNQSSEPPVDNWQLVWQDDFNSAAGSLPDSTNWVYDIGTGWGNNQLEYDTNRPQNVSTDGNGNLVITALKESYNGQQYTSARITTKGKFEFTYGKIEARMQLPWGQGIWPAFWMLGSNIDVVPWPGCGEIDIMELFGQQPYRVMGSLHGPGYSGGNALTQHYDLFDGRFDTGFHTFTAEWGENYVKFFVDGNLYQTFVPSDANGTWVFNHPFYIILNLAVGGNPPGSPNSSTVFPQKMIIDYVRVYQQGQ